jgi:hypothetical protein
MEDAFRSMYGDSQSSAPTYRFDLVASDFVNAPENYAVGTVKVTGKGTARPSKQLKDLTVTPVLGQKTNWAGTLPAELMVPGGKIGNKTTLGIQGKDLAQFKTGSTLVVMARVSDGEVVLAMPVNGNEVILPGDAHANDDVDGGDPNVVSLAKLKALAKAA